MSAWKRRTAPPAWSRTASSPRRARAIPVLLFRGLDGARRAMRLAVVDRIEEVDASAIKPGAGQLRVQLGEAILPLAAVPEGTTFEGKVRLFRLNDGSLRDRLRLPRSDRHGSDRS